MKMKEGEIYIYKKGQIFRIMKIYNEPSAMVEWVGHNDSFVDTLKNIENLKMKKLFP